MANVDQKIDVQELIERVVKNALDDFRRQSINAATKAAEKTADEVAKKSNIGLKGKGNTNQLHIYQDVNTKMENASKQTYRSKRFSSS